MERMSDASAEELLALIDEDDFDPDERDRTHGLQTFIMSLCHMDIQADDEIAILIKLDTKTPNYSVQDSHGRTVLMHACIGRKPNIVHFVTSRSGDVTVKDNEGNSVLVYAIKSEECELVEYILGCDMTTYELLSAQNNLGLTALDFAKRTHNDYIIRLVEDHMPTHPSVKNLRKRQDKRQPRLPPAAVPTASKPLMARSNGNVRIPFYHSKSLDTCDHVTNVSYDRSISAGCASDMDLRDVDSNITPRDNDITPRGEQDYRRNSSQKSFLPQINSRSAEQPRNIDRRKCRRDSVSLPDLRDLSGILVSSGTSTPASKTGSRLTLTSQESLAGSEDVFEIDLPKEKASSVKTLPALLPLMSSKADRTLPSLTRTRKKSNSAEDVQRSVIF